ncbi:xanthine dehydrogenase family protein molybdopterin-binding subunit [Porphyrobacter sp. LM 6]|uniref:xanthine dehydrogenase family protein molybdopterin-binding subunit n=1 Tax=Porphyrobacter sp. LM 6 TaxID=1896196 RepID=UPI000863B87F|nr:molybdopterin cofactor-binding domain-containing protein [Porphyrobacter sp. LM 6]AOL94078.1 isoquinoline 1-oxidoreductase, beta subunit [Porphyrobacter sp. LM 6]
MLIRDLGIIPARKTRGGAGEPSPYVNLSRRAFVGGTGLFVLGVALAGCSSYVEPEIDADAFKLKDPGPSPLTGVKGGDATPALWIEIERDGTVKITCHRSEMGQQVWTSMAQIVADELEAEWDKVRIVQAEGHERYGDQNTDGSRSVRFNFHRLRVAGAAMRQMLVAAAALYWKLPVDQCSAQGGLVSNTQNDETLSYGNLAELAGKLEIPAEADIKLKTPKEWRYINEEIPSLTVPRIVKGDSTYGIDVKRPGMVYAVVARPPQLFGKIGSVDDAKALAVPGVLKTVRLPDPTPPALFQPLGGVAVVARDTWAAIEGRRALEITWRDGPNAGYDSDVFAKQMQATARRNGKVRRSRGDVGKALAAADKRITAEYYAPHLNQSPMEPPSATAEWNGDLLECWACVQDPQSTRDTLAGALGIDKTKIKVTPTWLGGAFGRKSKPDFVLEAALIAREVGKPVKVTWTREDDIQHGYYHSASAQYCEAGLDKNGKCTAWLHRTVFPPISSTFDHTVSEPSDGEMGLGATDLPFAMPNLQIESGNAKGHVRIGWLRSVSNIYHVFAAQSFAAELAHAAGRDQKDYLLELIGAARLVDPNAEGAKYDNYGASLEEYPIDTGRLRTVVEKAAAMARWGRKLPKGRGLGIAVHRSFLSYIATVVEVAVRADGTISIPGVWLAVDAGTVINPRHVRAQMEGGTIYGLSNALYGAITAKNGAIVQDNFPSWRLLRMNEAPREFEVEIIASNAVPGGVGEPATPPAAPALANAIFAATGHRLRSLPLIGPEGSKLKLPAKKTA